MFAAAPPIRFADLPRPAFGRAAAHQEAPQPAAPQSSPRHASKEQARYVRAVQLAAEALPELPREGESVHLLLTGFFDLMTVISSTVRLLPRCKHLRIATLAMNRRNSAELVELLDHRRVESLTLLVSEFYRSHNKDTWDAIRSDLTAFPNVKVAAARNHAKIATFESPDSAIVFESSANLRSNRCSEFLTAFNNQTLAAFHSRWIDDLTAADLAKPQG